MHISILLVIALCLAGCISTPDGPKMKFEVYGNFCGPNHPLLKTSTREEQLIELAAIDPIDDLDAACKVHDLCYVLNGEGLVDCDTIFTKVIVKADFEDQSCRIFGYSFLNAVSAANNLSTNMTRGQITSADLIATVITSPYRFQNAWEGMRGGLMLWAKPKHACMARDRATKSELANFTGTIEKLKAAAAKRN